MAPSGARGARAGSIDRRQYCPIVRDRSPTGSPHPAYVPFTSDAYVAEPETEVEESTAAWLEEQAAMPFIREVARRTFELMEIQAGDAVLDVGCGTGVLLPALAEAVGTAGRVTGLDHSAAFLTRAHRRLADAALGQRVDLVRGDALALPFETGTFDVTHMERVLMHLPDPDAAIRELARVTRPGGRVVCAEVYAHGVAIDSPDRPAMDLLIQSAVGQIRNPAMGIELRRRLLEAGLERVHAVVVAFVETVIDESEIEELRRKAVELADRGELDLERARSAIDHVVATNAAGTYTGLTLMFVAVGVVPGVAPEAGPDRAATG
jgi:ubiquinone/menaquinone biosynthesis C-methylase UbiE